MKGKNGLRLMIQILSVILFIVSLWSLPAFSLPEKNSDQKKKAETAGMAGRGETKKLKTERTEESERDLREEVFHPREEIIVTATMTPRAIKDCTLTASVVTPQELKALHVANAMNALMFMPGVFVMRTGDFGRADVEIRGLGQRGQRIGVMVDGRPEKMGPWPLVASLYGDNLLNQRAVTGPGKTGRKK